MVDYIHVVHHTTATHRSKFRFVPSFPCCMYQSLLQCGKPKVWRQQMAELTVVEVRGGTQNTHNDVNYDLSCVSV